MNDAIAVVLCLLLCAGGLIRLAVSVVAHRRSLKATGAVSRLIGEVQKARTEDRHV